MSSLFSVTDNHCKRRAWSFAYGFSQVKRSGLYFICLLSLRVTASCPIQEQYNCQYNTVLHLFLVLQQLITASSLGFLLRAPILSTHTLPITKLIIYVKQSNIDDNFEDIHRHGSHICTTITRYVTDRDGAIDNPHLLWLKAQSVCEGQLVQRPFQSFEGVLQRIELLPDVPVAEVKLEEAAKYFFDQIPAPLHCLHISQSCPRCCISVQLPCEILQAHTEVISVKCIL